MAGHLTCVNSPNHPKLLAEKENKKNWKIEEGGILVGIYLERTWWAFYSFSFAEVR